MISIRGRHLHTILFFVLVLLWNESSMGWELFPNDITNINHASELPTAHIGEDLGNSPAVDPPICGDMELEYVSSALWTGMKDVVGTRDFAYCAMSNGLMVLDITVPSDISIASQYYVPDLCLSIYLAEPFLYLCTRTKGMMIFDISDGNDPELIEHYESPARVWDIEIQNDILYQLGNDSMYVYSLTDGTELELLGGEDYGIWAGQDKRAVAVDNGVAYIAAGRLTSIDVSDKHNPIQLDILHTWHEAIELEIRDTVVIVADRSPYSIASWSSLTIVNAKLPGHLHSVGRFEFTGSFWDIVVDGNIVYGAMGEYRFAVFDITDHAKPQLLGCYPYADIAKSLFKVDNKIMIGCSKNPFPADVAWTGDICYQFDQFDSIPPPEDPGLNPGDFLMLDLNDPLNPTYLGSFGNPGYTQRLTVQDDIVFASDEYGSIASARILPNGKLEQLDVLQLGYGPDGLDADGDYLAVAKSLKTVDIIDISSPTGMELVGTYTGVDWIPDVVLRDTLAFVCEGGAGLSIVNIADPSLPELISRTNTADAVASLLLEDNLAYVACRYGGLEIIDVSNLHAPVTLGRFPSDGEPRWIIHLAKEEDILAVGAAFIWYLIDVSDPRNPELLSEYQSGESWGAVIRDQRLYLAAGTNGVEIVDISDPKNPCNVGRITEVKFPVDVLTTEELLLVANWSSLLSFHLPVPTDIIEATDDEPSGELPVEEFKVFPNPFNASTTISFTLLEPTRTKLDIYNIMGQKVRSLSVEPRTAGTKSIVWDGADASGTQVASGMYLCRLSTESHSVAKKIILLK